MRGKEEVRGEGRLPDGLKRKPLRSQLCSGFLENVSGSRYQQLWLWMIWGGDDQQMLAEQLPTEMGGLRTSLAMLWTPALPTSTLRRQTRWLTIRAPPVGSWP